MDWWGFLCVSILSAFSLKGVNEYEVVFRLGEMIRFRSGQDQYKVAFCQEQKSSLSFTIEEHPRKKKLQCNLLHSFYWKPASHNSINQKQNFFHIKKSSALFCTVLLNALICETEIPSLLQMMHTKVFCIVKSCLSKKFLWRFTYIQTIFIASSHHSWRKGLIFLLHYEGSKYILISSRLI